MSPNVITVRWEEQAVDEGRLLWGVTGDLSVYDKDLILQVVEDLEEIRD